MKLLAVALAALFTAAISIVAYGWIAAPDAVPMAASSPVAGSANLDLCKRIVADTDAGSPQSADVAFGRYSDEGVDTCRTLITLHEME